MIQALLRYGKAFLRWYWNRVKEVPLVCASFAVGGAYVAFLLMPYLVRGS